MFSKGPAPGATPRADFLKRWPGAICKLTHYENGMRAFVVTDDKGDFITARPSPGKAWEQAYSVMLRREELAALPSKPVR